MNICLRMIVPVSITALALSFFARVSLGGVLAAPLLEGVAFWTAMVVAFPIYSYFATREAAKRGESVEYNFAKHVLSFTVGALAVVAMHYLLS